MLTLPIYWDKGNKTILLSMNWYRNAHFYEQNKAKQHFHQLIAQQITNLSSISNMFTVDLSLFYKNPNCDTSNVCSMIEKFTLDALQEFNIITNDNVKFHMGSCYRVAGQDKVNPRCEVSIKEIL